MAPVLRNFLPSDPQGPIRVVTSSSRICFRKTLPFRLPQRPQTSPRRSPERRHYSSPACRLLDCFPLADVNVQAPETPSRFRLRLDVYTPSQVLQIDGCLCHLTPASLFVGVTPTAGSSSLHGHYAVSPLLLALPATLSPSFLFPGVAGYRSYLLQRFLARGEEGFSSCLMCPCHRAVANTPPKWFAVSVSLRRTMLPSSSSEDFGLWGDYFSRLLCVHFRYGPMTCSPS